MIAEEGGEVLVEDEEPQGSKKKKGPISKFIVDLFEELTNSTLSIGKASRKICRVV